MPSCLCRGPLPSLVLHLPDEAYFTPLDERSEGGRGGEGRTGLHSYAGDGAGAEGRVVAGGEGASGSRGRRGHEHPLPSGSSRALSGRPPAAASRCGRFLLRSGRLLLFPGGTVALLEHATPDPMGRMRTAALLTGRTTWTCCHRGPSEWPAATAAVRSPWGTCLVVKISSALALLTSHPLAPLTFIICPSCFGQRNGGGLCVTQHGCA